MSRSPKPLPALLPTEAEELTEKQAAFVEALIANGGHREQAAIEAGYAKESAAREAWRLLRHPLVAQAVSRAVHTELASMAPEMLKVQRELAVSAKSGMVKHLAAKDLLDRAGYKPIDRQQLAVGGELRVTIDLG